MKTMFKKALSGAILAAAVLCPAQATPLSALLNGGSITAGDKLFDNWTMTHFLSSDGRSFDAANIEVTALNDGGMDPGPGLQFDVKNGALTVTGDDLFAFVDLMFGFRATVLTPGLAIKDASLSNMFAALGSNDLNDGFNDDGVYIRETLGTASGLSDLGVMQAEFSILDSKIKNETNVSSVFAPQQQLWVTKNILVWALESTDTAQLASFTQRFSQVNLPEPGSWALVVLALAGLAALRRKPA